MTPDRAEAVLAACAEIASTGESITFTQIVARTGISRATLYRHNKLRNIIEQHRQPKTPTLTELAAQVDQLRESLETIATRIGHHDKQQRTQPHAGPAD